MKRSFASDNNSGIHPEILAAMAEANSGHAKGYGDDEYTERAAAMLREAFGEACSPFFVFNGTGGNVVALNALLKPYEAVLCTETAHINVDECGAPERFTGCKLITMTSPDGKIRPEMLGHYLHGIGVVHHVQPKVVAITQSTELGTIYTVEEIRALADYAHGKGLYLYVDGARFSNAAAALGVSLQECSVDAGVDMLTFGGTKNGMMLGEAVLVFDEKLARDVGFLRKQSAQLASKMRFISAQFCAYLDGDLWLQTARSANRMARLLGEQAAAIPGICLTQPVQANAVFATMPPEAIERLQAEYFFYVWDEERHEVRWVCSFDTTEQDVAEFVGAIRRIVCG